ncbi:MAG TPA: hypothetical protein VHO70_19385 [Chitinispirillaceae bacterium]|nr:hypothetical protein [Chitinispirillaceae bacterium]
MDILNSTYLSVPMIQISLLLLISTIALLYGRIKFALLINYCFTLYWGYILNMDVFCKTESSVSSSFTYMYLGFGLVIVMFAIIGFISQRE